MTKSWNWTELKVFADDKLHVGKMIVSLYDDVENNVRKGENAGNQHFLLFPLCFAKFFKKRAI